MGEQKLGVPRLLGLSLVTAALFPKWVVFLLLRGCAAPQNRLQEAASLPWQSLLPGMLSLLSLGVLKVRAGS